MTREREREIDPMGCEVEMIQTREASPRKDLLSDCGDVLGPCGALLPRRAARPGCLGVRAGLVATARSAAYAHSCGSRHVKTLPNTRTNLHTVSLHIFAL